MKKILVYALVCILLLAGIPAAALAVTAESPILLGGAGDESYYGILPLPNGNLILSMATSGEEDKPSKSDFKLIKAWLVCLVPDGSILWESTFGADRDGGYTTVHSLMLNEDDTFCGTVRYEIDQRTQYRQKLTFSCIDGSILSEDSPVPDTTEEDKIFRNYYPNGNAMIVEEVYDSYASCQPRILHMLDADQNELWQLDTATIGLNHMEGWVATEKGALLYGRHYDEVTRNNLVVATLIAPDGRILWTYRACSIQNGSLNDGIVDSKGRFIALGFSREGSGMSGSFSQLVFCLDAATGNELWMKTSEQTDRRLPYDHLAELDGQYILCGSNSHYTGNLFEALDQDGRETHCWSTSIPEHSQLTPRFFLWNGELWTVNLLSIDHSDVILERVVIPE